MAELVAEPFVSFLVDRLAKSLSQEWTLLRGVGGQVQQMQNELQLMQCFLTAADARRQEGDEIVGNWVAQVRELSCDAEDAIATFVVKVALRKRGGVHHRLKRYFCIFNEAIARRKVGLEIELINKKIANLTRSLKTYGIQSTPALGESSTSRSERMRQLRQSYPHVIEDNIVGLDDDVQLVVDHLVNKKTCRVVSIWGMGGLGKTTLAKKVYNHIDVRRHFDCFAWVYISQQCNAREVLEEILIKLLSPISHEQRKEIGKLKFGELAEKLHGVQSEKKCLVILDDIWKGEAWDRLSPGFPKLAVGSKILLTTRIKEVALHIDEQCLLHGQRHLTEKESCDLFQKKVAPMREGEEFRLCTEMMLLAKKMVKHCGGLPLAIVVLGGLLARKQTLGEWEKLGDFISKGKGQGGVPIKDVLALSYHDLPFHLKACFLYLSLLPEDESIRPEKLVQMWMAEGFVSLPISARVGEVEQETMLDVGMSYLDELIQRCMIQVGQLTRYSRRVKFCRLHDLMRDLCLSKAEEENFVKVVVIEEDSETPYSSSSLPCTIRRLAVYYLGNQPVADFRQIQKMYNHYHVRSCQFYFFGKELELSHWQHIKSLLKGFKLLRVLSLEKATFNGKQETLPRDLGNITHLRYLSIRESDIVDLPSSIGNLGLLQTLDLRTLSLVIQTPSVLGRLTQLRHLYFPESWVPEYPSNKLRLDGLSKLETLVGFDTKLCDVRYFSKLTNLRKLGILCEDPKDLEVILKSPSLSNSNCLLRKLYFGIQADFQIQEVQSLLRQLLGCRHLHKLDLWGNLAKLPNQFPPNLTRLALVENGLEEDPMPTLEKLPNLRYLYLSSDAYVGKKMVCSAPTPTPPSSQSGGYYGGFPQLKFLSLEDLDNLEEWMVEEGAMPSLLHLEICRCAQLKEIPYGLRFVTTLQELFINGVLSQDEVREGGKDFYKVQHVPSIIVI